MRTGGCSIQQSLSPEAATIVKQAITLAKRRGHAQVTPIHVASVLLASPAGLLKTACLKSHSHPFQCKALELCFNVALNRLPTMSPSPILGPHSRYPALANALMAAFKRAQAHQRRGSVESQQQPILALKIETEQLVISILDDPSVSRVMREAGFSSTHVKSNVEQAVSVEDCSRTTSSNISPFGSQQFPLKAEIISPLVIRSDANQTVPLNPFEFEFSKPFSRARNEDVSSVMDSWMKRREKTSVVLVGECLSRCEGVVRGIKERAERGDVPLVLRFVQFINCPLLSMKDFSREEIDFRLGEIRCRLKGFVGRGAVLYLGDLRWVAEYWAYYGDQRRHYYCPVEHLIVGLRRLVFGNMENNGRLWLMGIASFNTYMKCKAINPPLETLLDLHPVTIPAGSLDLSLNLDSSLKGQHKSSGSGDGISWQHLENKIDFQLICCTDCSASCRREATILAGSILNNESTTTTTGSSLPSWLLKCKEESNEIRTNDQQETVQIKELCKKWNLICSSVHKKSDFLEKTINFASCSPSSSTSISSYDNRNPNLRESKPSWPIIFEPKWTSKEHQFLVSSKAIGNESFFVNELPNQELLSNPNSTPNSASSSEATEGILKPSAVLSFKEYNHENLEAMCSALEKKIPWQKDIIPEIASTILQCRSGMMSRECIKSNSEENQRIKQETWLFFLGLDDEGKLKMARELARLIFGTHHSFKSTDLSSFSSSMRADSTEEFRNKRGRHESEGHGYLKRFAEMVRENPHRVFYVEDVEQVDQRSQKGIEKAIHRGNIALANGETVPLEDAVIIFSCESFSSASRACSPPIKQKLEEANYDEPESHKVDKDDLYEACSSSLPLDLNIAADDGEGFDQHLMGDIRILESVDKQVFFKIQVL